MVDEPGRPRGRYVELDAQRSGHLYQRGAWIEHFHSILETMRGPTRILRDDNAALILDELAMRSERRLDPVRISRDGQVWWGAQVVAHAQIADLGDPADSLDDGAPLAMTLDGFPPAGHLEEWVHVPTEGVPRSDSWYTPFSLPDLEPLDACETKKVGRDVVFECARGDHPRVVVSAEHDAVVVTTTPAVGSLLERRFAIAQGTCVDLEAGTGQKPRERWHYIGDHDVPLDEDPFTWMGTVLANIPGDPTDRCAAAPHDGPEVEIRIDGPPVSMALCPPGRSRAGRPWRASRSRTKATCGP